MSITWGFITSWTFCSAKLWGGPGCRMALLSLEHFLRIRHRTCQLWTLLGLDANCGLLFFMFSLKLDWLLYLGRLIVMSPIVYILYAWVTIFLVSIKFHYLSEKWHNTNSNTIKKKLREKYINIMWFLHKTQNPISIPFLLFSFPLLNQPIWLPNVQQTLTTWPFQISFSFCYE